MGTRRTGLLQKQWPLCCRRTESDSAGRPRGLETSWRAPLGAEGGQDVHRQPTRRVGGSQQEVGDWRPSPLRMNPEDSSLLEAREERGCCRSNGPFVAGELSQILRVAQEDSKRVEICSRVRGDLVTRRDRGPYGPHDWLRRARRRSVRIRGTPPAPF